MRKASGQGKPKKDISSEICEECHVGKARVVYMKSRDRFFWGCSNSTLENKCKGSKAWQKIEVPESLREEVRNFLQKEDASSSDETSNKKRKTD